MRVNKLRKYIQFEIGDILTSLTRSLLHDVERSDTEADASDDVNTALNQYESTVMNLLENHAPLSLQRISARKSDRW